MNIAIIDLVANPGAGQRFTGTLAREIAGINPKGSVTLIAPKEAFDSDVFGTSSSCKQVGLVTDQFLQRWLPNHRTLNIPGSWQASNLIRSKIRNAFYDLEKQILSATKNADLIYFPWPNFVPLPALFDSSVPMVMTIHDLLWKYIKVYEPQQEDDLDKLVANWLRRMDAVVAITRHLQADLARYFLDAASRVEVIHQAATRLPDQPAGMESGSIASDVQKPYILMVAGTWGHKNHANLLRAISGLSKSINKVRFIFAGIHTDQAFGNVEKSSADYALDLRNLSCELGLTIGKDILGLGTVSDADLALLYSNADAVIVPSLIEGCSLPLLEAAAVGKPVLCSDISAHREMAEYYGIEPFFFDPYDPLDIERSLWEFFQSERQAGSLRETAMCVNARTWQDVARQYNQIFESAV
jgi:glycosyltransferase involved in cell wall biosynthesis